MAISLSQIQSTWGGSNPISLSEYYQSSSSPYIGPNAYGGSGIASSGAINMGGFVSAQNTHNWSRGTYINGDQANDGMGYSLDYFNPGTGKYSVVLNFAVMTSSFSLDPSVLTYATSASPMPGYIDVYQLVLTTPGVTVQPTNNNNKIKSSQNWAVYFSGNWIIAATLNSNNTVTLNYNTSGSSGDAGTAYALARQRDAMIAMFGSYNPTVSISV